MASKNEMACVYASLILIDDDVAVTGEKIQTILKSANVDVEPYWPGLFAKALENVNPKDLLTNVGSGVGATTLPGGAPAAAAAATAPPVEAPKAVEKKKEEEEESDDDMGFGLFD